MFMSLVMLITVQKVSESLKHLSTAADYIFYFFFYYFFEKIMQILADNSHEISSLICTDKAIKKKNQTVVCYNFAWHFKC